MPQRGKGGRPPESKTLQKCLGILLLSSPCHLHRIMIRPLFLSVIVLLLAGSALPGQELPKELTVYVKPAKPFAMEKDGKLTGYSVDLWNRVAQDLQWRFRFKTVANVPEVIEALQSRQADIGVGALSMTSERETVIDFSHPIYESGLQILVARNGSGFNFVLYKDVAKDALKVIGVLLLALLANAHLLWFVERRKNPESFPAAYVRGVWEAAWGSVCTLITGGCENKAPIGVAGRLFAIVWMLAGIGLVSFVTAKMASIMTARAIAGDVREWKQLAGRKVGTVTGSSSADFLNERGIKPVGFTQIEEACAQLEAGDLDAVVYDEPILRYYLSEHPGSRLDLTGERFAKHDYGFALPEGSPFRKEINEALLKLREEGFFDDLTQKWFPVKG
jgi:polar amino acid transport system substrate-binding protein